MVPVMCRVKHDPENGKFGDCLRACVASILEYDAEQVPHFFEDGCTGEEANERMRRYLRTLGLQPFFCHIDGNQPIDEIYTLMKESNPNIHYILYGKTSENINHVVVCINDEIAHDPTWFKSRVVKCGDHGLWTILLLVKP